MQNQEIEGNKKEGSGELFGGKERGKEGEEMKLQKERQKGGKKLNKKEMRLSLDHIVVKRIKNGLPRLLLQQFLSIRAVGSASVNEPSASPVSYRTTQYNTHQTTNLYRFRKYRSPL